MQMNTTRNRNYLTFTYLTIDLFDQVVKKFPCFIFIFKMLF